MTPDLIIGIDSSTTAAKAIAFDRRGRIVAEGRANVPLFNPQAGWFEQEVADWTGGLAKALCQDEALGDSLTEQAFGKASDNYSSGQFGKLIAVSKGAEQPGRGFMDNDPLTKARFG